MSDQKLVVEFKEELRGKNALHFWIGVAVIVAGIYMWWNGYFSEGVFAQGWMERPDGMAFGRVTEKASQGMASSGMQSGGLVALSLDTIILIGWGAVTITGLMRKVGFGLYERLKYLFGGVLVWADEKQDARGAAQLLARDVVSGIPTDSGRETTVYQVLHHQQSEIKTLKAFVNFEPPPKPEPPKTPEQLAAENAELKAQLAQKDAKPTPKPRASRAKS